MQVLSMWYNVITIKFEGGMTHSFISYNLQLQVCIVPWLNKACGTRPLTF